MISITKINNTQKTKEGTIITGEFAGKSTDTKPTPDFEGQTIGNGSVLVEIDTEKIYFFDADIKDWVNKEE